MRLALLLPGLALSLLGCGVECGAPNQANGTYAMFANPITQQATNEAGFPSYMTPANGWSEWEIRWNTLDTDQVDVKIDGQSYAARGAWDDIECGSFHLESQGLYQSVNDSTHDFEVDGQFVLFGNQVEGVWDWSEAWTARNGEQGTFSAHGQVRGERIGRVGDR